MEDYGGTLRDMGRAELGLRSSREPRQASPSPDAYDAEKELLMLFLYNKLIYMYYSLMCLSPRWSIGAFHGRPSGRTVCSRPRSFTVSRTHFSSPYGRPLSMLTRTRPNSFVIEGVLTRAVQFACHSTGRRDKNALTASCPRPRPQAAPAPPLRSTDQRR